MKTYLDCIPCFFKQALDAARIAGCNEAKQKEILDKLCKLISEFDLNSSPPVMGRAFYRLVEKVSGNSDPFNEVKEKANKLAVGLYPKLKELVEHSEDRLLMAIELAISGNVIDYGVKNQLDVDSQIERVLSGKFPTQTKALFEYKRFKEALASAETILYLTDNTGEILFDRILIEELNKEVVCALRDKPIINDATIEDAKYCGLDKAAVVISSGCDAPGILLDRCSEEFLHLYEQADLIISKGQGNFEALTDEDKPIYFLFKVKCPVVAKDVGGEVGDIVLKGPDKW
ncbi:MAG: ARMT1-like domain-containing protein [bacterium]